MFEKYLDKTEKNSVSQAVLDTAIKESMVRTEKKLKSKQFNFWNLGLIGLQLLAVIMFVFVLFLNTNIGSKDINDEIRETNQAVELDMALLNEDLSELDQQLNELIEL